MLRVVVKPSDEATKPSSLGMSHSILKDVRESLSAEIDLTTASEDDIVITLLSTKKVFKFTFDTRYQITDIQPWLDILLVDGVQKTHVPFILIIH